MNDDLRRIVENIFGKSSSPKILIENKAQLNKLLPHYLYKYRALNEFAVDNVCNRNIWFDILLNMNDPYEGRHTYNNPLKTPLKNKPDFVNFLLSQGKNSEENPLAKKFIEGKATLEDMLKMVLPDETTLSHMVAAFDNIHEKSKQQFHDNFLKQIFICSFSEKYDSVLMWAHYTNNHSGFCIEYDLSHLPLVHNFRNLLYPVIYDSEIFDISDFLEGDKNGSEYSNLYMLQAIIRKSLDWAYEHEWRVIFPFGTLKKSQNIPTPKPSGILLGSNFFKALKTTKNNSVKEANIDLALKLTSYCEIEKIPFEITKISSKEFLIERQSISYDDIYKKLKEL